MKLSEFLKQISLDDIDPTIVIEVDDDNHSLGSVKAVPVTDVIIDQDWNNGLIILKPQHKLRNINE
jgi:hypothetical protein